MSYLPEIRWTAGLLLAFAAMVFDVRTRRVPNALVYPFIIAGIGLSVAPMLLLGVHDVATVRATCVGAGVIVFVGTVAPYVAWRRKMAGGGIVKLALALSFLLPVEGVGGLFVATIVWAVGWRLKHRVVEAPSIDVVGTRWHITPFFLIIALLVTVLRFARPNAYLLE